MRLVLVAAAAVGAWVLLRRRSTDGRHVVVAWDDGSELELRTGTAEREQLLAIAEGAMS